MRLSTGANKANVALLSGAAITVLSAFWSPGPEVMGAVQTILTAALVWYVGNK